MSNLKGSQFLWGLNFDETNNFIDLSDALGDFTLNIKEGDYCYNELADYLAKVILATGRENYKVTFNRQNCRFVIETTDASNFSLLTNTGTSATNQAGWELLGFDTSADKTGSDEYQGDTTPGEKYNVQFCLWDYKECDNNAELKDATVSETASGRFNVVHCGKIHRLTTNLKYINDIEQNCRWIQYNPTGVQDARDFLCYAIQKKCIEFIPDCNDPDTFFIVRLESTRQSRDGVAFELTEMIRDGLCDFYETGILTWRVEK